METCTTHGVLSPLCTIRFHMCARELLSKVLYRSSCMIVHCSSFTLALSVASLGKCKGRPSGSCLLHCYKAKYPSVNRTGTYLLPLQASRMTPSPLADSTSPSSSAYQPAHGCPRSTALRAQQSPKLVTVKRE